MLHFFLWLAGPLAIYFSHNALFAILSIVSQQLDNIVLFIQFLHYTQIMVVLDCSGPPFQWE